MYAPNAPIMVNDELWINNAQVAYTKYNGHDYEYSCLLNAPPVVLSLNTAGERTIRTQRFSGQDCVFVHRVDLSPVSGRGHLRSTRLLFSRARGPLHFRYAISRLDLKSIPGSVGAPTFPAWPTGGGLHWYKYLVGIRDTAGHWTAVTPFPRLRLRASSNLCPTTSECVHAFADPIYQSHSGQWVWDIRIDESLKNVKVDEASVP